MSHAQWICTPCGKAFGRKGDLTRHNLLHTGLKPFRCNQCGKAFVQANGLKTHLNVHSKAKPFSCPAHGCDKAFGDPSSRARHLKETHLRRGAFKCPHENCKSSIKRRSAFTAHLKKHGISPEDVDVNSMAPPLLPLPTTSVSPRRTRRRLSSSAATVETSSSLYPVIDGTSAMQYHHQAPHTSSLPLSYIPTSFSNHGHFNPFDQIPPPEYINPSFGWHATLSNDYLFTFDSPPSSYDSPPALQALSSVTSPSPSPAPPSEYMDPRNLFFCVREDTK